MRAKVLSPVIACLLLTTLGAHAADLADTCHASSSYDLNIAPDRLTFDRARGTPRRVELFAGHASSDGVALHTNTEDGDRLALFDRELRALLPKVRDVANAGVDLAMRAVREETAGLGLSADSRGQIEAVLVRRGDELRRRIAASRSTRDWQGPAFDGYADAVVADIAPIVAADLGAQAISAAVNGDLDAAATLRSRAQTLNSDFEPRLERRMQALRPRIAALCPAISRLHELQRGVRDGNGHALDLLDVGAR